MPMAGDTSPATRHARLLYLTAQFLKIGAIGFGGGMAVIALIERECVRRRKCVEAEEFLHGVGLGQILGPFAVNAAIFIGYRMAGIFGGLVAATAFMLPSLALVIALSWLYFTFHTIPSLQGALAGVGPVVIALILSAAGTMGFKSLRHWPAVVLAILGCAGSLLHVNPVWLLIVSGATGLLLKLGYRIASVPNPSGASSASAVATSLGIAQKGYVSNVMATATLPVVAATTSLPTVSLTGLATTFLKVGLVFFGGGFVLIPVLYQHLVGDLGWLTQRQFTDGVAISQLTPGPIAVLATFAGYHLAGVSGACLATAALMTPAILLMTLISRQYERFRNDERALRFLAGVNPAVTGLVLSAALLLGRDALGSWRGWLFGGISLLAMRKLRWHPALLLAAGAVVGYAGMLP